MKFLESALFFLLSSLFMVVSRINSNQLAAILNEGTKSQKLDSG